MENYLVIARKWRPQTFEEMIGQDHVSRTLFNALRSGRLHHALLFTGPRGVGKTSSARILAKSLKCPNSKDYVPCNACSTCEEIITGSNMDVMEIDGASHNGVDAIRELRETVGYMPSQGKHKIYIVDEVHMLSVSAFNALLKTLEEPPPHVIFIFATTEPQKIPLTILSRVQRFDFRRIPTRLLADRLEDIAKKEQITYDRDSLWLIARQADGSARDSQSLLDQIITFTDGKVDSEKTIEVLGLTNRQLILDTLRALVEQNTASILDVARNLYQSGSDSKVFVQDLLEALRNALILKLENNAGLVDLPDSEIEALKQLGSNLGDEDLHFLFDMALKGSADILRAQDQRLALEMVLLRMAQAPRIMSLMAEPARQGTLADTTPKVAKPPALPPIPRSAAAPIAPKLPPPPPPEKKKSSNLAISPAATLSERWTITVSAIKNLKPFLGAKLDHVELAHYSPGVVKLTVPKDKKFIFEQISATDSLNELRNVVSELWSESLQVNVDIAETVSSAPIQTQERKLTEEKSRMRQEVESHPLVQSVKSNFKVQIKSITNSGSVEKT